MKSAAVPPIPRVANFIRRSAVPVEYRGSQFQRALTATFPSAGLLRIRQKRRVMDQAPRYPELVDRVGQ